ncbi:Predicted preprotein translocase subunit [Clostridium kluyveri DSM 555]|uniref:Predicted preprotein translocase subunit n=1 Tax=Clostridium kluyveri (strain ATCC 8527 / DSM 555 / NBRC 12016 / NCIMB 10680 / K1) TaxID=431943 RepID=A5N1W6_CLOK5|nr:Predicted preprotein translocase subunit [Clostridium kluyveri DSM 555]
MNKSKLRVPLGVLFCSFLISLQKNTKIHCIKILQYLTKLPFYRFQRMRQIRKWIESTKKV